jgi:hypothetical protein
MNRIWTIFLLATSVRGADVTLWMTGQWMVENGVRCAATDQAARMFQAIGVSLEWAKARPAAPHGVVIEVRFTSTVFPHPPESLAFSTPFDPNPVITVLYDHIDAIRPVFRARLLAHVLAHEIGHVLMRMDIHSADGVMKAHWTDSDVAHMALAPLPFMSADKDRIRRGLASFAAQPRVESAVATDAVYHRERGDETEEHARGGRK